MKQVQKKNVVLMCDLETLGTKENSIIRQIAIIPFLAETLEEVGERLVLYPNENCQCADGRTQDESTLKWWALSSNKEVNDDLKYHQTWDSMDPYLAAVRVLDYVNNLKKVATLSFMARGASTFDYPILNDFIGQYIPSKSLQIPFYRIYDLRSFTSIFEMATSFSVVNPHREGKHNALDDCVEQIQQIKRAKHFFDFFGDSNAHPECQAGVN